MVENAPPSANPANRESLTGVMREVLSKFLQRVDDMLPATVVAFDRASNIATVRPMVMLLTTVGETLQRAPVSAVPVFQIGAGGFVLNFNLKPGDMGWIKANDRDISLFMQSGKEEKPNTLRLHSFEDGVFFPSVLRDFVIDGEDEENVVLQTLDGTQRIAIWPDKIKITSTTEIILDAPETMITGNLTMGDGTQDATFNGTLNVTGDVIAGAETISLVTHVHDGVTTGGGNTGEPVA